MNFHKSKSNFKKIEKGIDKREGMLYIRFRKTEIDS